MRDATSPSRALNLAARAVSWHPSERQAWLVVLVLVVAGCVEAVVLPGKRGAVLGAVVVLAGTGFGIAGRLRERREHAAVAARLAALPPGGIPDGVIELVAAGRKIQAIKRYRELTGVSLREASAFIDNL